MITTKASNKWRLGVVGIAAVSALSLGSSVKATWEPPQQSNLWDRQNYTCYGAAPGCNTNAVGISGLAVTPDGLTVLSTEGNLGRVHFLDASTGAVQGTVTVGSAPRDVVVNSSGTTAYVANTNDLTISVIDTSTLTVTSTVAGICSLGGSIQNMAITPNNSYLIVSCSGAWTNAGASFDIIDTTAGTVAVSQATVDPAIRIAVDPSSNFFYGASKWGSADTTIGNNVSMYALPSGALLGSFDTGDVGADGITNIALNGSGTKLYVLKDSGAFSQWENLSTTPTKSWQVAFTSTVTRNVGGPSPLVVDNTNGLAYFVTENCCSFWPEIIEIVDLNAAAMLSTLQIEHQWATSAALSPDGTKLFTAGRRFSNIYTYDVARTPPTTTTSTTSTTTSTTTTLAPTTTTGDEESTTTTADQQEERTSESLPTTGGRTSNKALPVLILIVAGLSLIVVSRSRQVRA